MVENSNETIVPVPTPAQSSLEVIDTNSKHEIIQTNLADLGRDPENRMTI